jgi:hypothetical protein
MHTQALEAAETQADQNRETSPAIVVLSSSLIVLYANRSGAAVLRELKDTGEQASIQIPAPVLAYLADGILKNIDMRRMLHAYTPFSITCSIQGPARIWYCQAFGLPSHDEIDRSRIVLLFSDKPPRGGEAKRRKPLTASPHRQAFLDIPVPATSLP